jgi:hypothetical protein
LGLKGLVVVVVVVVDKIVWKPGTS